MVTGLKLHKRLLQIRKAMNWGHDFPLMASKVKDFAGKLFNKKSPTYEADRFWDLSFFKSRFFLSIGIFMLPQFVSAPGLFHIYASGLWDWAFLSYSVQFQKIREYLELCLSGLGAQGITIIKQHSFWACTFNSLRKNPHILSRAEKRSGSNSEVSCLDDFGIRDWMVCWGVEMKSVTNRNLYVDDTLSFLIWEHLSLSQLKAI